MGSAYTRRNARLDGRLLQRPAAAPFGSAMKAATKRRSRRGETPTKRTARSAVSGWITAALMTYAALILIACIVPFARGGNPYPEGTGEYWAIGLALVAVAGIATRAPQLQRWTLGIRISPTIFSALVLVLTVALSSRIAVAVFRGRPNTSD